MAVKSTFDFDQMLSSAREAYAEELLRMADEGLDFTFTYSDNVAPSSSAGKLVAKYPDRCFNFGISAIQNQFKPSIAPTIPSKDGEMFSGTSSTISVPSSLVD